MVDKMVNKTTKLSISGEACDVQDSAAMFRIAGTKKPVPFELSEWSLEMGFAIPDKPGAVIAPVDLDNWVSSGVFVLSDPGNRFPWLSDMDYDFITADEVADRIASSEIEYRIVFSGIGDDF